MKETIKNKNSFSEEINELKKLKQKCLNQSNKLFIDQEIEKLEKLQTNILSSNLKNEISNDFNLESTGTFINEEELTRTSDFGDQPLENILIFDWWQTEDKINFIVPMAKHILDSKH